MLNIAVFASGSGTNAENLARLFNNGSRARISLVVCNRKNAGVYARMEALGVETQYVANSVWDNEPEQIVDLLRNHDIGLVVLAGFMHFVSPVIINAFKGRIINIHPSLLPAYGGKGMYGHHVHEAVIAAGEKESGVTVHYVTEEIDGGEIVLQQSVEVTPDDTAETLEAKIHPVEYDLYPRAVMRVIERLDEMECAQDEGADDDTPPEVPKSDALDEAPAVDEAWAERLKIKYDPAEEAARRERMRILPPPGGSAPALGVPAPAAPAGEGDDVMPSNYLVWSVLCTLCCCFVPGIVAIVFSAKVNSRWYAGDKEGARRASRMAEIWIVASFCLGVIAMSFTLPIQLLQNAIGL